MIFIKQLMLIQRCTIPTYGFHICTRDIEKMCNTHILVTKEVFVLSGLHVILEYGLQQRHWSWREMEYPHMSHKTNDDFVMINSNIIIKKIEVNSILSFKIFKMQSHCNFLNFTSTLQFYLFIAIYKQIQSLKCHNYI